MAEAPVIDDNNPPAEPANNPPPEPPAEPTAIWPEDWRARFSGGDEKLAKRAEMFASPEEVWKSYLVADKTISEGIKPPTLPDDPTDEQIAEYHEQVGVPKEWTDYNTDLGNGVVWGDEDKPMVDSFLEWSHQNHIPQQYVTPALGWYAEFQKDTAAAREVQDQQDQVDGTVALREVWGGDYQVNLNAIKGLFESVDQELFEIWASSRTPDGTLLGNSPQFMKAVAQIARQANPAAMIAPGSTENAKQSLEGRLDEIKKIQNSPEYRRMSADERNKIFNESVELIEKIGQLNR